MESFASPVSAVTKLFGRSSGKQKRVLNLTEKNKIRSHLEDQPDLVKILGDGDIDTASARLIDFLDNEMAFHVWLNVMWARVGGDIFLQLWDMEKIRPVLFNFLRKEHLVDNDELFLRWWDEAEIRGVAGNRVKEFVNDSLHRGDHVLSGMEATKELMGDPFWNTLVRNAKESENLRLMIEEISKEQGLPVNPRGGAVDLEFA